MELAIESPLGIIVVAASDTVITALNFVGHKRKPDAADAGTPLLREAADQLRAYFARRVREFDLPLAPDGTKFQKRVWRALSKIPYGETLSYGEVAKKLGTAPRPIGGACGSNRIAIVIPCHRVLAAQGALGGYSSWSGPAVKRFLLELEGVTEESVAKSTAAQNCAA
ncbi:MAG: methylated-DNA--[protein]-cysteine S-methyltransferase [Alphaproteobacteria bacterium]